MAHIARPARSSRIFIIIIYYYALIHSFEYLSNFHVGAVRQVNVTLDDDSGGDSTTSIEYGGANVGWHNGQTCGSDCVADVAIDKTFNRTWHDASSFDLNRVASITVRFFGTGLSIYCILANVLPNAAVLPPNYAFTMDGRPSGPNFIYKPKNSSDYQYNVMVYSIGGLTNDSHIFELTAPPLNGSAGSLVLFDYLTYTQSLPDLADTSNSTDTPTSPPPSPPSGHSNLGAIVGGTIGGIATLLTILALVYCTLRMRQQQKSRMVQVEPGYSPTEGALLPMQLTPLRGIPDTSVYAFSSRQTGSGKGGSKKNAALANTHAIPLPVVAQGQNTNTNTNDNVELHQRVADLEQIIKRLNASNGNGNVTPAAQINLALHQQIRDLQDEIERLRSLGVEREGVGRYGMTPPEYTS